MKKILFILILLLLIPIQSFSISLDDVMERDFLTLPIQPRAHIHTTASVSDTIATINVWQKLNFGTGSPHIIMQGGFTWDTTNLRIVWDENNSLNFDTPCIFIGAAQIQITSAISLIEVLELGLVVNGNITPPQIITPISFTNQAKINSFGANENFSKYTNPSVGDSRLQAGDYIEIWIRSTTNTPSFRIDGMNVTFFGR